MSAENLEYGEIEIGLYKVRPEAIEVELRVNDPNTQGEIAPARGQISITPEKLLEELFAQQNDPGEYGKVLTSFVFESAEIRQQFGESRAAFERGGTPIRLRILISPSLPELHGISWELLCDPQNGGSLATSQWIVFSRFILSRNWRVIKLRPKTRLRALIAVSSADLEDEFVRREFARAREALEGINAQAIGDKEPLTLNRLIAAIRQGIDILYLVCHGEISRKMIPYLLLQNENGTMAKIEANDLAIRINELIEIPRLVILASCESVGKEYGDRSESAQIALAPRLAEAGVPAVLAMQGKISKETIRRAMPIFFTELLKDGQIDRALAVARGEIREQVDGWVPALFLRLKKGCIWYEPGFVVDTKLQKMNSLKQYESGFTGNSEEQSKTWDYICTWVDDGHFLPILGPEIGEDLFGGTCDLAITLARSYGTLLTEHENVDLAKVAQLISTEKSHRFALRKAEEHFLVQISKSLGLGINGNSNVTPSELLDHAVGKFLKDQNNPYRILAELSAEVYLNCSPETLLYRFLKAVGKNPEAVYSSWRSNNVPKHLRTTIERPSPDNPWVYQVFGLFGKNDTVVLTEDDFLDYLIETSRSEWLSPFLRAKLMSSSLIFLGFRSTDWRLRVLYRMLMTRPGVEMLSDIPHFIQMSPDENNLADVQSTMRYLKDYFQETKFGAPRFSIYWGSTVDFLRELRRRLAETRTKEALPSVMKHQEGDDDYQ